MKLKDFLSSISSLVEDWYDSYIKTDCNFSSNLYESMSYSFKAGGKRLRPALVILGYNFINQTAINLSHPALPFAVGAEMIHTYSLIHDDLPGMDNDDIRRGKPTNHIVFGEATAILAGDALLTKAFELFLTPTYYPSVDISNLANAALLMAKGSGPDGMIAGQYVDMDSQGELGSEESLNNNKDVIDYIHCNKTAALISSSLVAGAILAGGSIESQNMLFKYSINIGRAFQIADDILDITSTTKELGKPVGSDQAMNKLTYPRLMGLENSIEEAQKCLFTAIEALKNHESESKFIMVELANYILKRRN